jgi:SecDF, P1 head subdomain
MSSLRTLLQNADPLRHEVPRLDTERERIRLTILRATPVEPSTKPERARLPLLAALALASLGIVALGYQMWLHGTTPVLAAVRFEVRLAEDGPIPGLVVARIADSGRVIYLHPEIVVSNDDIAQSWVMQDGPDRFGVAVEFLPSGVERMRQATRSHVGRPVAILIDGDVVMAPVVRSRISDSAVIGGKYTRAEADRIAAGIGRY